MSHNSCKLNFKNVRNELWLLLLRSRLSAAVKSCRKTSKRAWQFYLPMAKASVWDCFGILSNLCKRRWESSQINANLTDCRSLVGNSLITCYKSVKISIFVMNKSCRIHQFSAKVKKTTKLCLHYHTMFPVISNNINNDPQLRSKGKHRLTRSPHTVENALLGDGI